MLLCPKFKQYTSFLYGFRLNILISRLFIENNVFSLSTLASMSVRLVHIMSSSLGSTPNLVPNLNRQRIRSLDQRRCPDAVLENSRGRIYKTKKQPNSNILPSHWPIFFYSRINQRILPSHWVRFCGFIVLKMISQEFHDRS